MSTARKILSNTVAQIIGKFTIAILGLAVVKITTNYLSQESFGQYIMVYEFLAFFGIAADLGLFTVAVREMSEDESQIPKIIGNILTLRTILITVMMLAAIGAAFLIPEFRLTAIPLGVTIAAITTFITIINGTITSVLQAKLQMGVASIANVLGKVISVSFMVYIIFWGFPEASDSGFYALLFAGIVGNLMMLITTNHFVKKVTPLKYQFDIDLWKKILKKSLPYGLALILNAIYFRVDTMLIYFIRGEQEVAIYGVAMKMLEQFVILPLYFMNSVLPVLTKALKEQSEKYKKIIRYSFDFLAALSVPMVVGGVVLAFPIIFVVSKPEYLSRLADGFYGSDVAFQILIFALFFQFINILFAFVLISVNKQMKLLYINAGAVAFNIITNLMVIPEYGFRGAAITSVISEFIILIAAYHMARRYLPFTLHFKNLAKIIFSALVMGAAVYYLQPWTYSLIQNWNVFPLIFIGVAVYAIMLVLTKTIDRNILSLLKKS